jgi:IS1 family transposase
MANILKPEKRAAIISALVEGNSIRATARMVDVSKDTVTKLMVELGTVCAAYQDGTLRSLSCKRIQVDEIWSFVYSKSKNVQTNKQARAGAGSIWTWVAVDADTKLVPCWMLGTRDADAASAFLSDLASRLAHRVQLTSDGHRAYYEAVQGAFGAAVDFAMLVKLYGSDPEAEKRYSPSKCIGASRHVVRGNPDPKHISTSYVERQNLTMRMSMRRFTRLTNAFSKKLENHAAAVALHFMHYNFGRVHQTLRVTPAMAAKVSDHVWSVEEMIGLL